MTELAPPLINPSISSIFDPNSNIENGLIPYESKQEKKLPFTYLEIPNSNLIFYRNKYRLELRDRDNLNLQFVAFSQFGIIETRVFNPKQT